eukprot:jgi/Sobl393_1/10541/SZX77769.1
MLMPAPHWQLDKALLSMEQQQQWWLNTPHPGGGSINSSRYIVVLRSEPTAPEYKQTNWEHFWALAFRHRQTCSVQRSVALLQTKHPNVLVHHMYTAVFQGFAFSTQQQQQRRRQQRRQWRRQLFRQLLHRQIESPGCALTSTTRPDDVLLSLAADPCVMAVYPDRRGRLRAALMASHPRTAAAAAAVAPAANRGPVFLDTAIHQQQSSIGSNIRRVNAARGNKTHGAAAVAVALIDTGIAEHPDLPSLIQSIDCIGAGRSQDSSSLFGSPIKQRKQGGLGCRRLSRPFDLIGHGTMVAGILAGKSSSSSSSSSSRASCTTHAVVP